MVTIVTNYEHWQLTIWQQYKYISIHHNTETTTIKHYSILDFSEMIHI